MVLSRHDSHRAVDRIHADRARRRALENTREVPSPSGIPPADLCLIGTGPAPLTGGTVVREVFDERHVPLLYIDMDLYLPKLNLPADARSKALYGAHRIAGRIEDL